MFFFTVFSIFTVVLCQEYNSECPEKLGVQTYAHSEHCDQFYLCTNGTLTLEQCGNGLLYDGKGGAAYHHCNYHWAVDCGARKAERECFVSFSFRDPIPHDLPKHQIKGVTFMCLATK